MNGSSAAVLSAALLLLLVLLSLSYLLLKLSDLVEQDRRGRRQDTTSEERPSQGYSSRELRRMTGELLRRDQRYRNRTYRSGRRVSYLTFKDRMNLGI